MDAAANSAAGRARIYNRLARHNRSVAVLRWVVPGLGVLLAATLIAQIVIGNLAEDYGASGIRVEQDQVVIEEPRYGGVTGDGMRYDITAEEARVQMSNTNLIDMTGAVITTSEESGYTMTGRAGAAHLDLEAQQVTVDGLMTTEDSDGVAGELYQSLIDWPSQTLTSDGPVRFEFEDGAVLEAESAVYDAEAEEWSYGPTKFTHPGGEPRDGGDVDQNNADGANADAN